MICASIYLVRFFLYIQTILAIQIKKSMKFIALAFLVSLTFNPTSQKKEKKLKINIINLKGAYGGDEETENAYFGIYDDTIYYPDSNVSVSYKLKKDSIITKDDENYIEKYLILKLTTDSLILHHINLDINLHLNRRGNK